MFFWSTASQREAVLLIGFYPDEFSGQESGIEMQA